MTTFDWSIQQASADHFWWIIQIAQEKSMAYIQTLA